ncbi:MAG: hypothetical protein HY815_30395 [Candidatus Riflebacteria bacterium]|nr:hypothetical protein [Candidatus Riflebacteria bacterium]
MRLLLFCALGLALLAGALHAGAVPLDSPFAKKLGTQEFDHAYDLLLEDRVFEGGELASRALQRHPEDGNALILAGVVRIYQLELEEAQRFLDRASKHAGGSAFLHIRRGDLNMALGNFHVAQMQYRKAIQADPRSALAHLNLAASLVQDQKVEEAKALLDKSLGLGIRSKEEKVTRILIHFLLGDLDTTRRLVAEYLSVHAEVATLTFIKAVIELRAMNFALAGELLAKAADRGIQNASLVYQVSNLYVALNRTAEAYALLVRACKLYPRSAKLGEQFKLISARHLSLQGLKTVVRGPFEVAYQTDTSPALLEQVLTLLGKHYAALGLRLPHHPTRIKVNIFSSTGYASPAYYNNLTGDITISGQFFQQASEQLGSFVDHAICHELSHLFMWDGKKGSARSVNCLWIDEGLAEYLAGGIDYVRDLGIEPKKVFAEGPLSMSDLIGNINILWHDNKKNVKAYLQSFYMVEYLMERGGDPKNGLALIQKLLEKVAQDIPLEKALPEVYKLTHDEFVAGWRKHLEKRVAAGK